MNFLININVTYKNYTSNIKESSNSPVNGDGRNHYVYRITNLRTNKHYYGSRVTKLHPHDDIGIKYFSSSSDKGFLKEQKQYPDNFKYKVIRIFDNPVDSILYESYLHQYFDVKNNINFINKSNQTHTGFSATKESAIKAARTMSQIDPHTGKSIRSIAVQSRFIKMSKIDSITGQSGFVKAGLNSSKARIVTLSKIDPKTGSSYLSGINKKSVATMSKVDPITGKSIYQNSALKRNITMKQVDPKTGLTGYKIKGEKKSGVNSVKFKGYFNINGINYITSQLASQDLDISPSSIRIWCTNPEKIITNRGYNQSKYLQKLGNKNYVVGKSFKYFGFNFQSI